jgi:LPS-assembly lipoprotein
MKRLAALLILTAPLVLGGCGLHPLYAGGGSGPIAASLAAVQVDEIGGKNGWLVRNALNDRLARGGKESPRYRLQVELDDQIQGFGLRTDNSITRERRTLRARYRLVDAEQGTVLLDATAGSDAGIDVVTSEYAVIAAEQTALERLANEVADQIVARLALYAHHQTEGRPDR